MGNSEIESTTSSLKSIIVIIAGLAITNAIITVLSKSGMQSIANLSIDSIFLFVIFLLNVIRFHHGNIRHLDTTYKKDLGKAHVTHKPVGSSGKTALDFFVILIQSVIFAWMSFLLKIPLEFFGLFAVVIAIDILWYLAIHGMVTDKKSFSHQKKWTINNVVSLFFLIALFLGVNKIGTMAFIYASAIVAGGNALVDFWISWPFYFPKMELEDRSK